MLYHILIALSVNEGVGWIFRSFNINVLILRLICFCSLDLHDLFHFLRAFPNGCHIIYIYLGGFYSFFRRKCGRFFFSFKIDGDFVLNFFTWRILFDNVAFYTRLGLNKLVDFSLPLNYLTWYLINNKWGLKVWQ